LGASSASASDTLFDIWYGEYQLFGEPGIPQKWANILGNVSDPDGISALEFTLNGGPRQPLGIGPDTRRLLKPGDFNVEILRTNLVVGLNQVAIIATDGLANEFIKSVTLEYVNDQTWPLPYNIEWDSVAKLNEAAYVSDGTWIHEATGVRPMQIGYDRLLCIGDITWNDYTVKVPVTVFGIDPGGFGWPSTAPGIAVELRWQGHSDWGGWQPVIGWRPYGGAAWYDWGTDGGVYRLGGDTGLYAVDSTGRKITYGQTDIWKFTVNTVAGRGSRYRFKVWNANDPEPDTWFLQGWEEPSDLPTGSFLLIAHHVDAIFGDVTVTPVDLVPPVISNIQEEVGATTTTITWTTNEPATSVIRYGTTTDYGLGTVKDPYYVIEHSITLTDLTPDTHYDYQVSSTDEMVNTKTSINQTFRTLVDDPTPTPVASDTPLPTGTPTATETPTAAPTSTPTATATHTVTETPTAEPTATPTEAPTDTAAPTATETPTAAPTSTPTATATHTVTETPTAEPTATPTEAPTDTATPTATETPTAAPTSTPTATATETPTPAPTCTGFEADVAPRPTGSGACPSIADWVLVGRFAAGLDSAACPCEFQKADCAPRSSLGDGSLSITDWVQAGRYASLLDACAAVGGPVCPEGLSAAAGLGLNEPILAANTEARSRTVRIVDASIQCGQDGIVMVELDSNGDENALGFSIAFDPAVLAYRGAAVGDRPGEATLIINRSRAPYGQVGFALALPPGGSFAAGTRAIVMVTFTAASEAGSVGVPVSFGDEPVARGISDPLAETLEAGYEDGTVILTPPARRRAGLPGILMGTRMSMRRTCSPSHSGGRPAGMRPISGATSSRTLPLMRSTSIG